MTVNEMNQEKAEEFSDRMIGILNSGALALLSSIGHRTGLFDVMSDLPPSTPEQIAGAASLNERYVREWLGAMVTGGIVEYDPDYGTYRLPPEHAASLMRAATPDNIAAFAQYIPLMGTVEDRIVDCFKNGGGVPYAAFDRFQEVMAESFPKSRFRGYDISEEAITSARATAGQRGLNNVRFEVKDVTALNASGQYKLVTAFDAIHDQAQPAKVLAEIAAALHPEGTFLMQDIAASSHVHKNIDHPVGPLLYTLSCMHCMTVSLASNGAGLGAMWGEEKARKMLQEAGFTRVEVKKLPHDFQNIYYIIKKNQRNPT
jgi:2-polyprenyl-3-methyl-5-hydroxy-6-metoxy-1,4-benzoquinol methylase